VSIHAADDVSDSILNKGQNGAADDYFEFEEEKEQDPFLRKPPSLISEEAKDEAAPLSREVEGGDQLPLSGDEQWALRKKALGLQGKEWHLGHYVGGVIGAGLTKIGAAGAQDKYTAGKIPGGIGAGLKGTVDTVKDLGKIGAGVDLATGRHGENSILNQDLGIPGVSMNTLTNPQFAPGLRAPDVVKAGLQDGGALLSIAGRGITAASGVEAIDLADGRRRAYIEQRDRFVAARDHMRERSRQGPRSEGAGLSALRELVHQRMRAGDLGEGVNRWGVRPAYDYSMGTSAAINNMKAVRTARERQIDNPSNPDEKMTIGGGEVSFERLPGTDPLNPVPTYQTASEKRAGTLAKAASAPGDLLSGLGQALDGTEHGQTAIREGKYLKGAAQATLAGARTIGKGAATIAAHPLGLGPMASALVDVGSVTVGGLMQAAGGGLNAIGGVGDKAREQRALEARNKHYFGQESFIKKEEEPSDGESNEAEPGSGERDDDLKGMDGSAENSDAEWEHVPDDPYFDSARGREVATRGLRSRDAIKEGNYEQSDRDVGLPEVDHGGAVKNWWHNRMKRPLQKLGQGLLKPLALLAKGVGYGLGIIPAYNLYSRRKRQRALAQAARAEAVVPQQAAPGDAGVQPAGPLSRLEWLEKRQEDLNSAGSQQVTATLAAQRHSYENSTLKSGVRSGLKLPTRDLAKENIRAWMSLHRRKAILGDLVRQNRPDPQTGESFAERQRREYQAWRLMKKEAGEQAKAPTDDMYEVSSMTRLFGLESKRHGVPAEMGMLGRAAQGAQRPREAPVHPQDVDLEGVGLMAQKYEGEVNRRLKDSGKSVEDESADDEKSEDSFNLDNLSDEPQEDMQPGMAIPMDPTPISEGELPLEQQLLRRGPHLGGEDIESKYARVFARR
jgi:hypothetical protein